jgi:hypothetical protein
MSHDIRPEGLTTTVADPTTDHGEDRQRVVPAEHDSAWRERIKGYAASNQRQALDSG